jgi:hypothetical protein
MQQQCTLSIVWSQAFSFPASVSRYYRAKWLPGRVCPRFEFQFGHSNIEFICYINSDVQGGIYEIQKSADI